jgi:serine phosphatase RsbU (regulator of sigma subunit)/tetratricopeptide (TPR) repeat protein
MKLIYYPSYLSLLAIMLLCNCAVAQTGDKLSYYIVALDTATLTVDDRLLLDSNLLKYHNTENDTLRLDLLNVIVEECWNDQVWPKYNKYILNATENLLAREDTANLRLMYKLKTILAGAVNNEGYYYKEQGNIGKALEFYEKSLKIDEKLKNSEGVAMSLNNLGTLYLQQGLTEEALMYFEKSRLIYIKSNNKYGKSLAINNIAGCYFKLNKIDSALIYFTKSFKIDTEIENVKGAANSLNNIGYIHKTKGELDEALATFLQALQLYKKVNVLDGIALLQCNIGGVYLDKKLYASAILYADSSLQAGKDIGYPFTIKNASELLFKIYFAQQNWKEAIDNHLVFITMRDSLKNIETEKKTERQQLQYQFDKQNAIVEAGHKVELLVAEEARKRQLLVNYFTGAAILILCWFGYFVYNRLQITKKQHRIIELQKAVVDEKNTEIIDSIEYAKRIQQALLKSEYLVDTNRLPEHFVFFKPKDIISGDFYWTYLKDDYWYIAAADCTGHGVPGAMLTMLGNSLLNEIAQNELLPPNEILNQLRARITFELSQTGEDGGSKDGMDISLMRLHLKTFEGEWAGANNPLWIVRKGTEEVEEIKADRQPIGFSYEQVPFTNKSVQFSKGDAFYMFSDGFQDQFGGEKGKKFKVRPFKSLLLKNDASNFKNYSQILDNEFEAWRVGFEQIDDVCVIGVQV